MFRKLKIGPESTLNSGQAKPDAETAQLMKLG
jgi:hypothetical protein